MKRILFLFFIGIVNLTMITSCQSDDNDGDDNSNIDCNLPEISASSNVEGFGVLEKLSGIWNGPVFSPTPLGDYEEWIVDFRPISPSQISAKNELDRLNEIFMSFFVVKYDCDYKIAFRNGGGFSGEVRNSYMIIDSVNESQSQSFYRFSDPISGGQRVYTDVLFKQDSLIMTTYTNFFNTLEEPTIHMTWKASLRDETAAQEAISLFNFPKKEMTRDFSSTFNGLQDAVFYSVASDPYPESEQPYLGDTTVSVTISNPVNPDSSKNMLLIITTQPLFNGNVFQFENLNYRSRYVFLEAQSSSTYNFNYMHPGNYYVNALYDSNGDFNFTSGDFINFPFDVPFTLTSNGTSNTTVDINLLIP
ncbi:MAG: hypothetical protein L3J09_00760 [Flavobacteriaceae bacterium]|nr:hypothetical protein [Flavobacteriaceae bacterium]